MRKGGFNMYLTKEKSGTGFYTNYSPRFSKHQDVEIQAYVANVISNDLSKHMQSTVRSMSVMIAQGFLRKGKN